jgi:hypothetical protein
MNKPLYVVLLDGSVYGSITETHSAIALLLVFLGHARSNRQ